LSPSIYKEPEAKKTGAEGWADRMATIKVIRESQQGYKEQLNNLGGWDSEKIWRCLLLIDVAENNA